MDESGDEAAVLARTARSRLGDATRSVAFAGLLALRRATASSRPLPDFLVLGAQKAGTSTFYAGLCSHPMVLPAIRREVHYFDTHAGRDVGWYRAHFASHRAHRAVERRHGTRARTGESSPYYLFHPAVPERAARVLPDAQLIVLLRDPVARAVSEYHHAVRHGFERRAIEDALDPGGVERDLAHATVAEFDAERGPLRQRSYVARGHYAEQLSRWFAAYPRDRFLVLETPELRTGEALRRGLDFLGLPQLAVESVGDRNVQRYDAPTVRVTEALAAHYAPHDEALVALLGRDLSWTRPTPR